MTGVADPVDTLVGSVLFTDLVGFTDYTDALGDAAALQVLDRQTALATGVLGERSDARLVKELGDGLMLWFATAIDGLHGAIRLMEEIDAGRAAGTFPLAMRMGLHHGEVVVRGEDLVGHTVNIAARVADLAGPGELLVSDDVIRSCTASGLAVPLQPVGPVSVKGVQEPVWIQRLAR